MPFELVELQINHVQINRYFKHEMIGICRDFTETSNKVELRINRVRINRSRPVNILMVN